MLDQLGQMTSNAPILEADAAPSLVRVGMVNLIWRPTVCNEREEYCVTLLTRFGLGRGVSPSWWFGVHSTC
jgi:hypothetical protein